MDQLFIKGSLYICPMKPKIFTVTVWRDTLLGPAAWKHSGSGNGREVVFLSSKFPLIFNTGGS